MWVYVIKNREIDEQINLNKKLLKHEKVQDTRVHAV